MKFCSRCGHPVERTIPPGEDRPRAVCPACRTVHYQNPRMVVACLVEHGEGLLLCRRAIEPRLGSWTCPGGFLELEESVVEGARRETREEAGAELEELDPFAHFDVPHVGQAYVLFRARLQGTRYSAGPESLEVRPFPLSEIPWTELAFPVVRYALRLYVEDRAIGRRAIHQGVVHLLEGRERYREDSYELRAHRRHRLADEDSASHSSEAGR